MYAVRPSVTMNRLNYRMDSGSSSIMQQQSYHNMDSGLLSKTWKTTCTPTVSPIRISLSIFMCCTRVSLLAMRDSGKLTTALQLWRVIEEKQLEKPHSLEVIPTKNETRPVNDKLSYQTKTAKRPLLDSIVHEWDIVGDPRCSFFSTLLYWDLASTKPAP